MTDTAFLVTQGWTMDYPHIGYCHKFYETKTRCGLNSDKPGILVTFRALAQDTRCYQFELRGQLPDGTWVSIVRFSLPDDIEEGLKVIPKMIEVWELLCQSAPAAPTT